MDRGRVVSGVSRLDKREGNAGRHGRASLVECCPKNPGQLDPAACRPCWATMPFFGSFDMHCADTRVMCIGVSCLYL